MKLLALTALAVLFVVAGPVDATVYDFTQSGYIDSATAYGSFTGSDLDGDGKISSFAGEVTDFTFTFNGNASVPPFTLGFANLEGLIYDLDGTLGDSFQEGVEAGPADILIQGEGPDKPHYVHIGPERYFVVAANDPTCDGVTQCSFIGDYDNGGFDASTAPLIVTAVPEPAIWAMFIAGFGLIGAVLRRRPASAIVCGRV